MDFIREVASGSPVPAGGAAAAYALCLGISLVYKTLIFELKEDRVADDLEKNLLTVKKELERLLYDAKTLVKEDAAYYMKFAKSKKGSNTAQTKKDFQKIIDVNMKAIEKGAATLTWIQQIHPIVSEQMRTHLQVASELIMGAINGTVHVARDNLNTIKATQKRDNYLKRLQELQYDYQKQYQTLSDNMSVV